MHLRTWSANGEEWAFCFADSVVVKVLSYEPEGRGFDTRWGDFLNLPNPSDRTRPFGLLSL
jgi:hypothetical protein